MKIQTMNLSSIQTVYDFRRGMHEKRLQFSLSGSEPKTEKGVEPFQHENHR